MGSTSLEQSQKLLGNRKTNKANLLFQVHKQQEGSDVFPFDRKYFPSCSSTVFEQQFQTSPKSNFFIIDQVFPTSRPIKSRVASLSWMLNFWASSFSSFSLSHCFSGFSVASIEFLDLLGILTCIILVGLLINIDN